MRHRPTQRGYVEPLVRAPGTCKTDQRLCCISMFPTARPLSSSCACRVLRRGFCVTLCAYAMMGADAVGVLRSMVAWREGRHCPSLDCVGPCAGNGSARHHVSCMYAANMHYPLLACSAPFLIVRGWWDAPGSAVPPCNKSQNYYILCVVAWRPGVYISVPLYMQDSGYRRSAVQGD